jgi:hypothetical protein
VITNGDIEAAITDKHPGLFGNGVKAALQVAEAVAAVDGKTVLRQQRTAAVGQGIVSV